MNQRTFFDEPPSAAAATSPADTRKAARVQNLSHRSQQQRQVLDFIRSQGRNGASDHEVAQNTGLLSDSARARRNELMNLGIVKDSGQRRRTPSGGWARVWIDSHVSPEIIDPPTTEGHEPRDETNEDDFPF